MKPVHQLKVVYTGLFLLLFAFIAVLVQRAQANSIEPTWLIPWTSAIGVIGMAYLYCGWRLARRVGFGLGGSAFLCFASLPLGLNLIVFLTLILRKEQAAGSGSSSHLA